MIELLDLMSGLTGSSDHALPMSAVKATEMQRVSFSCPGAAFIE
jgi:hypothetical protein